jgi:hypothetical protein
VTLTIAACAVEACVSDNPFDSASTNRPGVDLVDGGADSTTPAGLLVVTPESTNRTWTRGRPATLDFTLQRSGGLAEDVTVTIRGLPEGSTVIPAKLSSAQTSGSIRVTTSADSPQGDLAGAVLEATSVPSGITATSRLDIFLRGAPGELDTTFGTDGVLSLPSPAAMGVTADGKRYVVRDDRLTECPRCTVHA